MPRTLHHVAVAAADFDASLRFYTGGLGFAVVARFDEGGRRVAMLRGEHDAGGTVELFEPAGFSTTAATVAAALSGGETSGLSPLLHLAVGVDDVDAAVARAAEHGAAIAKPPRDVDLPGVDGDPDRRVRFAFVTGPSGESVELIERSFPDPTPAL